MTLLKVTGLKKAYGAIKAVDGVSFEVMPGEIFGVILPEWLRFAQGWYLFVFGTAVILLMLWLPDGLLSIPDKLRAKRHAKEASAARAAAAAKIGAQS